jgi:tRNA threonylcarbamoyl adenosine modification protein (Sua5/YciO/YrdC/YwlC family)
MFDVEEAATMLADGQLLVLPTDTVYGVGARLDRPDAVRALFRAKGRPESVALPVLVCSLEEATSVGASINPAANSLAEQFWPGPLTIVVTASASLAQLVGASDSVGFRFPNDDVVSSLLSRTGPLVVTSANRHGEPPCTTADDVLAVFGDSELVAGVLDAGPRSGRPSTVVDARLVPFEVLREGPISEAALASALKQ